MHSGHLRDGFALCFDTRLAWTTVQNEFVALTGWFRSIGIVPMQFSSVEHAALIGWDQNFLAATIIVRCLTTLTYRLRAIGRSTDQCDRYGIRRIRSKTIDVRLNSVQGWIKCTDGSIELNRRNRPSSSVSKSLLDEIWKWIWEHLISFDCGSNEKVL